MPVPPPRDHHHLPPEIQRALRALRSRFEQSRVKYGHATQVLCYDRIHDTRSHDHDACWDVVFASLRHDAELSNHYYFDLKKADTPSFSFLAHFNCFLEIMAGEVHGVITELMGMGRRLEADSAVSDGIGWAKAQALDLAPSNRHMLADWVVAANDKDADPRTWLAPLYLSMAPAGRMPFDSDRAWERMDAADTREVLEEFADRYVRRLESGIEDEAAAAYLEAAKQRKPAGEIIKGKVAQAGAQGERESEPPSESERRKELINKLKDGTALRYAEAAEYFDVSRRTIQAWLRSEELKNGKVRPPRLQRGAKRGTITAESIKRLSPKGRWRD